MTPPGVTGGRDEVDRQASMTSRLLATPDGIRSGPPSSIANDVNWSVVCGVRESGFRLGFGARGRVVSLSAPLERSLDGFGTRPLPRPHIMCGKPLRVSATWLPPTPALRWRTSARERARISLPRRQPPNRNGRGTSPSVIAHVGGYHVALTRNGLPGVTRRRVCSRIPNPSNERSNGADKLTTRPRAPNPRRKPDSRTPQNTLQFTSFAKEDGNDDPIESARGPESDARAADHHLSHRRRFRGAVA